MILLCLISVAFSAAQAIQWTQSATSPANGTIIAACSKQDVTLAWSYTLSADEHLMNVEWHYTAGSNENLLATSVMGNFLVTPGSTQQLLFLPNAGIRIRNVNTSDAGTYSVYLNLLVHGSVVTHVQTVKVLVSDGNLTTDGQLHVTMLPEAVYDNSTQQVHVQLSCGAFLPGWGDRVSVIWSSPSSRTLPSTSYNNGRFFLSVPNPVTSGQYTCAIDKTSTASTCLQNPLERVGAVSLDGVQVQMMLMEERMKVHQLRHEQKMAELKQTISNLNSKLDVAGKSVSFHAELETRTYTASAPIDRYETVYSNEGLAFNGTSGVFTVPVSGTYIFLFSLFGFTSKNNYALLMVDYNIMNECYGNHASDLYAQGICQFVMKLRAGQRVWVQTGDGAFQFGDSYFTGALLHADIS